VPGAGARGFGLRDGGTLVATDRLSLASTMVVLRDPGEAYLLCHTGGDGAHSWVERFHPETLEVLERSPDLPGGPPWPGGVAVHANGSLYVVFGRHAHRLAPDTSVLARRELPRNRPYNSFVVLPDGHLATKDFGGSTPPGVTDVDAPQPAELLILEPEGLEIVARVELPEPSVARLSALGDDIYLVGDTALHRVHWDGTGLTVDRAFAPRYRTVEGQTFGWDAVLVDGAAWFLDDGEGSEAYAGSLRGCGRSGAPLHLVRVDLASGAVALTEISGLPGGIVANPPVIAPQQSMAIGYDTGNGRVVGFSIDAGGIGERRWEADLDHGCHPLLFPDTGEVLLAHHDPATGEQAVVLDVASGDELGRVATGSPVQSVLFPAAGFDPDAYLVSFTTLTRISVV
jgi:hypothetical protein